MIGITILICFAFFSNVKGYPDANITRVVGGYDAKIESFPWQVSVQKKEHIHHCGGSILNSRWILTAAHCFSSEDSLIKFYVAAGIDSLKKHGQVIKVKNIVTHPNYNSKTNFNDIALLELDGNLKTNDRVQSIPLPKKDEIPSGNSTLSGWGSTLTTTTIEIPDKLQAIDLPLIGYKECIEAYQKSKVPANSERILKTNICTGPLNKGAKGACLGDSGGPLIQTTGKTHILIGVVSWGLYPCGVKGEPSIYTRVSAYIDWINQHIKH